MAMLLGPFRLERRLGVAVAACALMVLCAVVLLSVYPARPAWAAPGVVYSCTVHPVYKHPVTGSIEDSGGASAAATGQAMVESCVSAQGQLEATDSGEFFLTIRMSLMDMTSDHEFLVQDWGATEWSVPAIGTTGSGSDANGTTSDVCIGIPSARGIVRVSMFVDTMGRDVVFYVYADGASEGAPVGFNATMVTEPSALSSPPAISPTTPPETGGVVEESDEGGAPSPAAPEGTAQDPVSAAGGGSGENPRESAGEEGSQPSSDAVQSADDQVEGAGAVTAQGLSLSTAADVEGTLGEQGSVPSAPDAPDAAGTASATATTATADDGPAIAPNAVHAIVLEAALAAVVVGLVLMLAASVIVYAFRRNWNRWGGQDPDDYSREYRDELC